MTQEQPQHYGVDQLIKIWDLVIEIGNVAPKVALASGGISKAMALLPLTDEVIGLLSLEPGLLVKEWKDFDESERKLFMEHAVEKLDLADEALELKVELGLQLVRDIVMVAEKIAAYRETLLDTIPFAG